MVALVLGAAVAAINIGPAAWVLAYQLALGHGAFRLVALPVALWLAAHGLTLGLWGVAGG